MNENDRAAAVSGFTVLSDKSIDASHPIYQVASLKTHPGAHEGFLTYAERRTFRRDMKHGSFVLAVECMQNQMPGVKRQKEQVQIIIWTQSVFGREEDTIIKIWTRTFGEGERTTHRA
jgi:RAB protein geranylgeranyltransferase component A